MLLLSTINKVFPRGVTAAILLSLNKGTTAMFVVPTGPLGTELYSWANVFLCFGWKTCLLITPVKSLYDLVVLKLNLKKTKTKKTKQTNKKEATPVMQDIIFSLTLNDLPLVVHKCHLECINNQAPLPSFSS